MANQRWLDIAVSALATVFVSLISFFCVFRVFRIFAASVGLIISDIMLITGLLSMLVRIFTQVEQDMNSAERILNYVHDLPQEASYTIYDTKLPAE